MTNCPLNLRVLIIVQNLPVPLDRRVWLECQALTSQGYSVSVICPKGPGDPAYEEIDGVAIHKYFPAFQAEGLLGYVAEFGYSWVRTALLSIRAKRARGFDVIQACNPPDTFWLLARLWRPWGVRFIFDQHDLNPELFLSRFGEPKSCARRLQLQGLYWLERMTYRTADRVISTNASYKAVAEHRGGLTPEAVTVVRSGPDTAVMRPIYPDASIRKGAEFLLAYLGVMGPQDGVENVLAVMHELVHKRGRSGVRAVLMGFGDCLEALRRQSTELNLDGCVLFTGRVGPAEIAEYLSAADLGLCPDLDTPLNNVSTMNKTMEYMAYGLPPVTFDLMETRVSAGEAGVFVPSGDIAAFADAIESLLDDPDRRVELGLASRRRVAQKLDWQPQAQAYVQVYDELLGNQVTDERKAAWPHGGRRPRPSGAKLRHFVNLDDEAELRRFLRNRTARGPHLTRARSKLKPRLNPTEGDIRPMSAPPSLRVLYSFPHALDRPGIATTALNQVRSLARRGIDIELHCTSQGKVELPDNVKIYETMTVFGRRVPHRAIGVQNAYERHDRIVAQRLKRGRPPDIVHAWPRGCLLTLSEARRLGVAALRECPNPHITSVQRESAAAVESAGVPLLVGHSHRYSKRVADMEVEEFRTATALLVPSAYAAGEFIAEGFPSAQILRHRYGCDIDRFYPTAGERPHAALRAAFLGRGDPTKGLHIALQAWALADLHPTASLKIAGSIEQAYADSMSHLCADRTVQLLGFVSDAAQLLRHSDVLLLPSWTEGSALVTYEAQASGCLPLVSRAAGAFGRDGVDFLSHDVGDVAQLTEQLRLLQRDRSGLLRLRSMLLADRRRFSWDSAAEVLHACYLTALRSG